MAQTRSAHEIIVVDDGSSDETREIQKDFPQIKYFYQKNGGVSSARNLGIKNATNDWVAFLDSDDEWREDKLQEQVAFHGNNPHILMSYTDERWIRDGVEVKMAKKYRKFGGEIFQECLSHCIIAPSATLIHKELLNAVGVFDESLEVCEDYDLWLRIASEHEIGLVDKKLITKYAGHENQLGFKHWGMDRFRVMALKNLLKNQPSRRELIVETLIQKYGLLLKGAIKYDKMSSICDYQDKIHFYAQRRIIE